MDPRRHRGDGIKRLRPGPRLPKRVAAGYGSSMPVALNSGQVTTLGAQPRRFCM